MAKQIQIANKSTTHYKYEEFSKDILEFPVLMMMYCYGLRGTFKKIIESVADTTYRYDTLYHYDPTTIVYYNGDATFKISLSYVASSTSYHLDDSKKTASFWTKSDMSVMRGEVGNYRYGFNGMEKDDEVKGNGNSYDYGARMYDSRLGRWLSIDPLFKKMPNESPYIYVGNIPMIFKDPTGRIRVIVHEKTVDGTSNVKHVTFQYVDDGQACLTVRYNNENFDRSDFKANSYEYALMHHTLEVYDDNADSFIEIEEWQIGKGKPMDKQKYNEKGGKMRRPSIVYPSYFKLDIKFNEPDKTTFDDEGLVDFESASKDLDFINSMLREGSDRSWFEEFGIRFNPPSMNGVLIIGYNSWHLTTDAVVKNPTLAKNRALSTFEALGEVEPEVRLYNGSTLDRQATIIITSSIKSLKVYEESHEENEIKTE